MIILFFIFLRLFMFLFLVTASLSNYQIRDLNDEINKLMREKHMWEIQLRNLGGPNYMRFAAKMTDEEGREIPGHRGYKSGSSNKRVACIRGNKPLSQLTFIFPLLFCYIRY